MMQGIKSDLDGSVTVLQTFKHVRSTHCSGGISVNGHSFGTVVRVLLIEIAQNKSEIAISTPRQLSTEPSTDTVC